MTSTVVSHVAKMTGTSVSIKLAGVTSFSYHIRMA